MPTPSNPTPTGTLRNASLAAIIALSPAPAVPAPTATEVQLPDPLVANDGERITSPARWSELRRPELLELFRKHVYGRAPVARPESLRFEVTLEEDAFGGTALRKVVAISFDGPGGAHAFPLTVYLPKTAVRPRGCFLFIANRQREFVSESHTNPQSFWPADQIIARGYAAVAFHNGDIAPDDKNDGFRGGVFGALEPRSSEPGDPAPRPDDAWGTIAAWSWGASRAIDYLATDPALRNVPIAVVGHSRGGKAALWCGAQDERVALAISNNSGNSGAALARTTRGETIAQINEQFPHWFAKNYRRYNHAKHTLPVDQHALLALLAPRLVYVSSASQDAWADPEAEFRACREAEPVFALHGLAGVGRATLPAIAEPLHTGAIGYHLRQGDHDLTPEDWGYFMDFADLKWAPGHDSPALATK